MEQSLTEFEQKLMTLVNKTTYAHLLLNEHSVKYAAKLLLPYAKKQLESEEKISRCSYSKGYRT